MDEPPSSCHFARGYLNPDEPPNDVWTGDDCEMCDFESFSYESFEHESDEASAASDIDEDTILNDALARYLVESSVGLGKDNIVASASVNRGDEVVDEMLSSPATNPLSTIPFHRNIDFVDRGPVFDRIRQACSDLGSRTALVGMGGVGKSQIALEFAYRVRDKSQFTSVLWVHAETRETLEEGYQRIAKAMKIERWDDPSADIVRLIRSWLCDESNGPWLLIVDNADDISVFSPPPNSLDDPLPQSPNGSILITTRSRDVACRLTPSNTCVVEVETMVERDALVLLQRKLGLYTEHRDAVELVQALEYMPLAITLAASNITQRTPNPTISQYISQVHQGKCNQPRSPEKSTEGSRGIVKACESVIVTWQISFEYIRQSRPHTAQLLSLMCLFDSKDIMDPLLYHWYAKGGDTIATFNDNVNALLSYSFITLCTDGYRFEIHQIVRSCTKEWLEFHREPDESKMTAFQESLLGLWDIHRPLTHRKSRLPHRPRQDPSGDVATVLLQSSKATHVAHEQKILEIQQWLSAPDPSVNLRKALKQRQHNTGLWLLESEQFSNWVQYGRSLLWLCGLPGAGKTVLASTIVQHVLQYCGNESGHVVAYFYFDFNDEQKQRTAPMLRSLICQLLQQSMDIPPSLNTFFTSTEDENRQPSQYVLLEAMRQLLQSLRQVYIVIDALDECAQRADLTEMLETVVRWELHNVHLLVTSRKYQDIENSINKIAAPHEIVCLHSKVVIEDIRKFVRQTLSQDEDLSKWRKDVIAQQEIENTLIKRCGGLFLWVPCQLDTLRKCRDRTMLQKSLATLPETLHDTYDRILSKITEEHYRYALRIFQWLSFSTKPLSVGEIAEAMAIDVTHDPVSRLRPRHMPETTLGALSFLSGLVTVVSDTGKGRLSPDTQVVELAHKTVKDYLISEQILKGQAARFKLQDVVCHSNITQACLWYLNQFQREEHMVAEVVKESKLLRYAATYWTSHLQRTGGRIAETQQAAIHFLTADGASFVNWIRIFDPDRPDAEPDLQKPREDVPTPLYYAALMNFNDIVKVLLQKGADVNGQGGRYGSALQVASLKGHEQIVKQLLKASGRCQYEQREVWQRTADGFGEKPSAGDEAAV